MNHASLTIRMQKIFNDEDDGDLKMARMLLEEFNFAVEDDISEISIVINLFRDFKTFLSDVLGVSHSCAPRD